LKKPAGSVQFRFYKQKTEKTKPKPGKKPSQTGKTQPKSSQTEKPGQNRKNPAKTGKTEPNWFELVFSLKNEPKPVGLTRFRFFFKKNSV